MEELIKYGGLIISQYGLYGILIFIVIYGLVFPEKAEKVSAMFFYFLQFIWKGAESRYIKHDIQSKINDYVKNYIGNRVKDFPVEKIVIEWVNDNEPQEDFIKNGGIVLRIRKSANQNKNLVNALMLYLARSIIPQAKSYISEKQKLSIDLFVAKKILEKEHISIMQQFIDDFLFRGTEDVKVSELFEKYDFIDKAELFFPVLIQELTFLGQKVFAKRKDQTIYEEFTGMVDFLSSYSQRKRGDTTVDTQFNGNYCSFALVIVGKTSVISKQGDNPYKNWIKKLADDGIETIYLIGNTRQEGFIKTLCGNSFLSELDFFILKNENYTAQMIFEDGHREKVVNYLTVLRKNNIISYYNSHE